MWRRVSVWLAVAVALLVGACGQKSDTAAKSEAAATPAPAVSPALAKANDAPPMKNGVYIAEGICFGEGGCPFKHWRASEPVEVRERLDPASKVIATVAPGHWVEALEGQLRLIPTRGVVRTARDLGDAHLAVGDVVYMLEPGGEGYYSFWWHGRSLGSDWIGGEEGEPIAWDQDPGAPAGAVTGWWVRVKLEDGRSGWIKEPRFECMGPLGGDEGCRG